MCHVGSRSQPSAAADGTFSVDSNGCGGANTFGSNGITTVVQGQTVQVRASRVDYLCVHSAVSKSVAIRFSILRFVWLLACLFAVVAVEIGLKSVLLSLTVFVVSSTSIMEPAQTEITQVHQTCFGLRSPT
jgi:hypothetical protein